MHYSAHLCVFREIYVKHMDLPPQKLLNDKFALKKMLHAEVFLINSTCAYACYRRNGSVSNGSQVSSIYIPNHGDIFCHKHPKIRLKLDCKSPFGGQEGFENDREP